MNIEELMHTLVTEGPIPAKDIAKAVGKPYSSLMRELNPNDGAAKLGANTFLHILEVTGDTKPLQEIAAHFGLTFIPSAEPGKQETRHETHDSL